MTTHYVDVNGVSVKTTVTNKASFVDSFITELILSCDYSVSRPQIIVGLSVELTISDDLADPKAATLQLCSGSRCVIVQLLNMDVIPESLNNFLTAPLFCFVGFGIQEKLAILRRDYGLECLNVIELAPFIRMGSLTGIIEFAPRPLNVVMGNWGAANLTIDQVACAAWNAHVFSTIGNQFIG